MRSKDLRTSENKILKALLCLCRYLICVSALQPDRMCCTFSSRLSQSTSLLISGSPAARQIYRRNFPPVGFIQSRTVLLTRQGRDPGARTPLLLDQTEARRAEKIFLGDQALPLSKGLDDRAPIPPLYLRSGSGNGNAMTVGVSISMVHILRCFLTVSRPPIGIGMTGTLLQFQIF